jgi:hypothetical protein
VTSETERADTPRSAEELRRRTQALATLLEVSRSLAATLDLHTVLQATTDGLTHLFGLQTAAVYLLDGQTLRLWATTTPLPPHFPEELRNAPLADHPHIREAITSGQPVLVPDIVADDLTPAERSVTEQRGLRSILFLPLIAAVESLGTLIVGSLGSPREITEADIDLSFGQGASSWSANHAEEPRPFWPETPSAGEGEENWRRIRELRPERRWCLPKPAGQRGPWDIAVRTLVTRASVIPFRRLSRALHPCSRMLLEYGGASRERRSYQGRARTHAQITPSRAPASCPHPYRRARSRGCCRSCTARSFRPGPSGHP